MSAQVLALRQLIADRFPNAKPLAERDANRLAHAVATGLTSLDRALPHGGFPRGKLTVWAPAGGAAAVLRSACRGVTAAGERAAWVDASGTLTFGWTDGAPLVVHAADRTSALRCAEVLLKSGAFAMVVLDGAEPVGTETVRLVGAVRDGGGAFVVLTERGSMAALRIASSFKPDSVRWRPGPFGDPAAPVDVQAEVRVRALGWNSRAKVLFRVMRYDLRDALVPGAADRRGGEPSGQAERAVDTRRAVSRAADARGADAHTHAARHRRPA